MMMLLLVSNNGTTIIIISIIVVIICRRTLGRWRRYQPSKLIVVNQTEKDQNLECVQHGDGRGYVSSEVDGRKIDVGEVGRVDVFREKLDEVGMGNGEGLKVGEGDDGDVMEAIDEGEGAEHGSELRREVEEEDP
ncbi:hypothetical protein ACSQ67_024635 [Phaseolus vulgaris]